MANELNIPKFTTEDEEAEWWYDHRDELAAAFEAAAERGTLRRGSAVRLAKERANEAESTNDAVQLEPDDAAKAHLLAAKRGLQYQEYIRELIHEALESDEKRLAR
jgi:predicted DNA binding CopG/RHH family protein